MINLEWDDFYNIGIDFIDQDHKDILTVMRELRDAITNGNLEVCARISDRMIEVAKNHFIKEEAYLEKVNYPDLNGHKKYHKTLLLQAKQVKEICEGINHEHDLMTCFKSMEEFLIDDVINGDLEFVSFLEHEGHIKPMW